MLEVLVLAVAPGLFLLWFFYTRDRYEREPKRLVAKTFVYGLLSPVLAFPLELLGESIIPQSDYLPILFLHVLLVVGLTEEGVKLLCVRLAAYRKSAFNEVMDGIVYTAAAALGFATLENVLYALTRGLGTTLIRAVTSVPGHALLGGIMGYYIGAAKFTPSKEIHLTLGGLLIAMILHSVYDFVIFAFPAPWNLSLMILALISMVVVLRQLINKAELQSPFSKWLISRTPAVVEPRLSCATCGRPLVFAQNYQKWYCSRCMTYKSEPSDFVWYTPAQVQVGDRLRKWCANCGAEISSDANYCYLCGARQMR
jgi:RsiW-degrading membrane proteinase PrsW (M82 family)/ribosomal protein S27AE